MADFLTKQRRSEVMSKIRSKNTSIEKTMFAVLRGAGVRFLKHKKGLPGSPDIVFPETKLAVFLDGGFWHGYRFAIWGRKLSPFWRTKIENNIKRDRRNRRDLKRMGWHVLRFWQHDIQDDPYLVALKILAYNSWVADLEHLPNIPASSAKSPKSGVKATNQKKRATKLDA